MFSKALSGTAMKLIWRKLPDPALHRRLLAQQARI
jgi:hypothetical protein